MFDHQDSCEFVFIWRTSEACPVRKSQGNHMTDSDENLRHQCFRIHKSDPDPRPFRR